MYPTWKHRLQLQGSSQGWRHGVGGYQMVSPYVCAHIPTAQNALPESGNSSPPAQQGAFPHWSFWPPSYQQAPDLGIMFWILHLTLWHLQVGWRQKCLIQTQTNCLNGPEWIFGLNSLLKAGKFRVPYKPANEASAPEKYESCFCAKSESNSVEKLHIQYRASSDLSAPVCSFPSLTGFSQLYLPHQPFIGTQPGIPDNLSRCLQTTFCLSLTGLQHPYVLQPSLLTTALIFFLDTSYQNIWGRNRC